MKRTHLLKYLDACDQVSAAIKNVIEAGSEDVAREVVPKLDDARRFLLRAARLTSTRDMDDVQDSTSIIRLDRLFSSPKRAPSR